MRDIKQHTVYNIDGAIYLEVILMFGINELGSLLFWYKFCIFDRNCKPRARELIWNRERFEDIVLHLICLLIILHEVNDQVVLFLKFSE